MENKEKKPEHFTVLRGDILVPKNHKQIILRGKVDSLKGKMLVFMAELKQQGETALLKDMEELFGWVNIFQRCEVTGEPMEDPHFLGLTSQEVREHSHNPKKYYGVGHLFGIDYNTDIRALKLNEIKGKIREMEITAYDVFAEDEDRMDMLAAVNRLSSGLYILELKVVAGLYK